MNVTALLRKIPRPTRRPKSLKWERYGETITASSYEVTERELKIHSRLESRSTIERFTS